MSESEAHSLLAQAVTDLQLAQNLIDALTAENARLRIERDEALMVRSKLADVAQRVQRLEAQASLWS